MKKIFTLFSLALTFSSFGQIANRTTAAFTPGNLVVYRVGDGSAALTNASTAVFLDEYTTTGTLVQSIAMPTAAAGANQPLTAAGTSTSEGFISLSLDQKYLFLTGYAAVPGVASISSTTSAAQNRVVGRVDASGSINTTTSLSDAYSAGNIRSVAGSGSDIWLTGSTGGVRYTTLGATTSTAIATTPSNTRVAKIQNSQLYISSSTTNYYGVAAVGSGLPTTTSQTVTLLPGFPTTTGPSSYDFAMNTTGDVIYVADDRSIATGGGIQKWTYNGSTWSLAYTLNAGLSVGVRGLTVNWGTSTLYGTTGSSIVSVVDAGASSSFTSLATAPTNTAFRGITGTPNAVFPISLLSFNAAAANNVVNLTWATVNENGAGSFQVERSANGKDFNRIGGALAAKNGSANNYNTVDANPIAGTGYYRLKMIDQDGSYHYSNIVTVKGKTVGVSVFPNPVKDQMTIQHEGASKLATISIIDFGGKQALRVNVQAGATQTSIDATKLAPGTYMIVYNNDGVQSTRQFVKQ